MIEGDASGDAWGTRSSSVSSAESEFSVIKSGGWGGVGVTFVCKRVDGLAGFDQDVLLRGAEQQHGRRWGFALHGQRLKL